MTGFRLKTAATLEVVLDRLAGSSIEAKPGEHIFQEGEKAHGCYLVRDGNLRLYLNPSVGGKVLEMTVGEGCLIGLPATINEHCYSLSCQAISDSRLALLSRDDITRLMREDTKAAVLLLDFLSTEVQEIRRTVAELA